MVFELYNKDCPWHSMGKCLGNVHYNQHVNDPRYAECNEYICPIFYWVHNKD